MKVSISSLIQIAKFMVFVISSVKQLVIEVEQQMPEPGRGAEKFAVIKKTLTTVGKYMGISTAVLETVDSMVADEINEAVATEINGEGQ